MILEPRCPLIEQTKANRVFGIGDSGTKIESCDEGSRPRGLGSMLRAMDRLKLNYAADRHFAPPEPMEQFRLQYSTADPFAPPVLFGPLEPIEQA
jgi:hypothetical protein